MLINYIFKICANACRLLLLAILLPFSSNIYANNIDSIEIARLINESANYTSANEHADAFAKALQAIDAISKNSSAKLKVRAYDNLSKTLRNLDSRAEAIEKQYLAIHFNQKFVGRYELSDGIRFGAIGTYHMQLDQLDSAIAVYEKAIQVQKTVEVDFSCPLHITILHLHIKNLVITQDHLKNLLLQEVYWIQTLLKSEFSQQ